jgi:hypothetical protein
VGQFFVFAISTSEPAEEIRWQNDGGSQMNQRMRGAASTPGLGQAQRSSARELRARLNEKSSLLQGAVPARVSIKP